MFDYLGNCLNMQKRLQVKVMSYMDDNGLRIHEQSSVLGHYCEKMPCSQGDESEQENIGHERSI